MRIPKRDYIPETEQFLREDFDELSPTDALDILSRCVNRDARSKGFWEVPSGSAGGETTLPTGSPSLNASKIALMHSELSELLEADRKGISDEPCEKDPSMTNQEEELADLAIRMLDYCGHHSIDLVTAIKRKALYNLTRSKKHGKRY